MNESIRILLVDDEDSIRKRCARLLNRQGYEVMGVSNSQAALDLIRRSTFDVMLVDIRMPGMDGMELLRRIKAFDPSIEVIMMTGYAAVETAVKAMKEGAYDYLAKPFDVDELLHIIQNVAKKKAMQREIVHLRNQLKEHLEKPLLIGSSQAMNQVSRFITKIAPVNCNILLQGESGTGKELVAKLIHANSPRSHRPFIVADCAALSGSILESELFGHVKGAFTGAYADRKGYFENASGGTIFLDEISELPPNLQGKLLRVVQEQVIVRLGTSQPLKVDLRIIAATNRDLEECVQKQTFRQDLFYRLNVVSLKLPCLREHREDIPLLIKHFSKQYSARFNLSQAPPISQEIMEFLYHYEWPGNVRELENAVQRAIVLAENGEMRLEDLFPDKKPKTILIEEPAISGISFQALRRQVVQDFIKQYLEHCLIHYKGNVTRIAQALSIRRTSLQRLMKQSCLKPHQFRQDNAS